MNVACLEFNQFDFAPIQQLNIAYQELYEDPINFSEYSDESNEERYRLLSDLFYHPEVPKILHQVK